MRAPFQQSRSARAVSHASLPTSVEVPVPRHPRLPALLTRCPRAPTRGPLRPTYAAVAATHAGFQRIPGPSNRSGTVAAITRVLSPGGLQRGVLRGHLEGGWPHSGRGIREAPLRPAECAAAPRTAARAGVVNASPITARSCDTRSAVAGMAGMLSGGRALSRAGRLPRARGGTYSAPVVGCLECLPRRMRCGGPERMTADRVATADEHARSRPGTRAMGSAGRCGDESQAAGVSPRDGLVWRFPQKEVVQ